MRLEQLQRVVHGQRRVERVQSADQADGQHVLAHRVDEAAAQLLPLAAQPERPAQRVDDAVERMVDAPDLLDAEAPHLRHVAVHPEPLEQRAGQVALCPLGQHRRLRVHLDAGLERAERLAVAVEALVAGAHADHRLAAHQQLLCVGLGQHHHAHLLGPLREVPAQLAQREDEIALVVEGRRRGDPHLPALAHDVDRLLAHLAVAAGQRPDLLAGQQVAQRGRVDYGAGQQVRADDAALVEQGDRRVAQLLGGRRVGLQQLCQPQRAGQAGGAAADEAHADVDPLILLGLGGLNELADPHGRAVVGWSAAGHDGRS